MSWPGTFTFTRTSSVVPSGYVTTTTPSFSPGGFSLLVVVFGLLPSFQLYVVPSGNPVVTILSSALGSTPRFTSCFGSFACGLYLSFCSLTSTLNWTVVVFAGLDLSETVTVATFASTVAVLSTFPVIVFVNGVASVAVSLVWLLLSGVNPVGRFVIVKFWTFPVLSETFTVIVAFSPRYTVTFGKLASGVDSESVVSCLFCTNLTVGLPFSSTLNQPTTASSEIFPERSVVLAITL